ncbi:hypothetical protein [Streptomyces anulatus]
MAGAPRCRPSAVAAVHDVVYRAGTWSGRRSCGGASSTTTGS